jgi:hypothetical protein
MICHRPHVKQCTKHLFIAAGKVFTKPLLSNDNGHTQTGRDLLRKRFMKYTVEMDSGTVTYRQSFMKIDSGIQKFIAVIYRHTDTQKTWRSHKVHFVPQNKECRLKITVWNAC